ncbi:MAG: ATP-binding protein [Chlorobi bacterium]|nr:ATP-binding protein [Chlorobiota bacterium]
MKRSISLGTIGLAIAIVFGAIAPIAAQEYVTILRSFSVNGQPVAERLWKEGIEIRPEDYIELIPAVRSTTGDTIAAISYVIEIASDEVKHQRTIIEPRIEYKGLPSGSYTLRIQAQLDKGSAAAPLLLRFRVGSQLSIADRHDAPTPTDTATAAPQGVFPLRLWIVLALATSIISLVLAGLLLKHRRRTRLTTQDFDRLRAELDATRKRAEQFEQQCAALERELNDVRASLAERLAQAEHHNSQLNQQNRFLREQVERLRAAKQRLEELQSEKDMLFGMIIHDIKNPLLVIENLVQLLRNYDSNSIETQQILNDLAETTSRIVALSQQVSRLLAIERSDGSPIEFQNADLAEILRSVIHRNAYLARRKNIQILEELPQSLPAECDPQRIEEVFDNILSNAIKYSHADSLVFVRAQKGDTHHTIEIQDHGVGMTNEDIQRLFERGAVLSSTPTAGEPSSGIGLWIVRRLVERHHGSISVQSTKGEGTTVTISLPITQPSQELVNGS